MQLRQLKVTAPEQEAQRGGEQATLLKKKNGDIARINTENEPAIEYHGGTKEIVRSRRRCRNCRR